MFKVTGRIGKILHEIVTNSSTKNWTKMIPPSSTVPRLIIERTLYSKSSLGLDTFQEQRERTKQQLSNLEEKFKERMKDYVEDDKNMIFTEDLKNMIHLVSNDEEAKLVISMLKRFNQQNKQLRFGSFKFGPVVMRLFHLLNKPDLAVQCFRSEDFTGLFDQLITYQILLDLLYENGLYKEVLENFEIIQNKQVQGAMFPRNSIVLALAACYKLNDAQSLDYAIKLWRKLEQSGYYPTRRAVTFFAGLSLKQGKAEAALEILSSAKNQNYTTVRNLKVLALANLGRLEDTIPILKSVLEKDTNEAEMHTFNRDVLEQVKKRVLELDNSELSVEFNRIEQLFQKQGHISEKLLDDQLCSEIKNPRTLANQGVQSGNFGRQYRENFDNRRPRINNRTPYRQRPGLNELV